ncbi:MAG: hypothetical protein M3415_00650 [Actinomycetota bacterium]|jgi:hypothetical protein|nr:hypothetical protein [Actinomycetota bacterium]
MELSHSDARTRLRIYLNDHLAGAAGAVRLARRCQRRNRGTALDAYLQQFVVEIDQDREVVTDLLRRLGMPVDPAKQWLATFAEVAGRLKLNGQVVGYSDLSRLVELEGLSLGVAGKLSLWRSLQQLAATEAAVGALDLAALIERAEAQRTALEEHRLEAVRLALIGV